MGRFLVWKAQGNYAELYLNWGSNQTPTGIRRKVVPKPSTKSQRIPVAEIFLLLACAAIGGGLFGETTWAVSGGWGKLFLSGFGLGLFMGAIIGAFPGAIAAGIACSLTRRYSGSRIGGFGKSILAFVIGGLVGAGIFYFALVSPMFDFSFPALL
jgi:hypothetical protein